MLSVFQFQIALFGGCLLAPPLALLCLLTVLMMSLVGLLAIWGGLGRGHWAVRAAVVLGLFSLLMTIPAFELVIVYVTSSRIDDRHWPHGETGD